MTHSLNIATILTLIVGLACWPGSAAATQTDEFWQGIGGLVTPLGKSTPVRIDTLRVTFTALSPPRRKLDNPRFAERWEVSTRMWLTNGSKAPCTLTLGLPQVPTADPERPAAIREVVISLDHKRMRVQRTAEPGPALPALPATAIHHKVSIDFEPGQTRRVDTLFRMPAVFAQGAVRFRFLLAGATRFSGTEIGQGRFDWEFGDRVRLIEDQGKKLVWIAEPPAGAKHRFFDDGDNSKLEIELKNFRADPKLQLAITAVGQGPSDGPPLLGKMRPLGQLSTLELKLARWVYLALHGRRFREPDAVRVFEQLPWEECNPAFLVANGRPVEEKSVAEFIAAHPCQHNCTRVRRQPVDPYGPAWTRPLCWYSPVHNLSLTQVVDPKLRERIRAIMQRLAQVEAAARETSADHSQTPAESGCRCSTSLGSDGPRNWRPSLLSLAFTSIFATTQ